MPAINSSWLEISASAISNNLEIFRKIAALCEQPPLLGVVLKGNAYGHGFEQMVSLVHGSVDYIFVIDPADALRIRKFENQQKSDTGQRVNILVIGAIEPEEALELAKQDVCVAVGDASWERNLQFLRNANSSCHEPCKLRVHVHLDTGLSREGYTPENLEWGYKYLHDFADVVRVEGIFSHFANTEDVTDQLYANFQLAQFQLGKERFLRHYATLVPPSGLLEHFAASAAALVLPSSRLGLLRVGISLYGLWPSIETKLSAKICLPSLPQLSPVLSWRCQSQIVKVLQPGTHVGYGCTWRAEVPTTIAVLPVGYFDGYPRLASGRAHVLVQGKRASVIGRIMMNHMVIDISGVYPPSLMKDDNQCPSSIEATLLGASGGLFISAEQLAAWSETIPYEILTRLGQHLKRIVVK